MNAVNAQVLTAPRRFEWREFPIPQTGDDDALAEVLACGLCGSDVASFLGTKENGGEVILGHEVIARVDRIGSSAARRWGVAQGDRIALEEGIPCMNCPDCRSGRHRVCTRAGVRYGDTTIDVAPSLWGGFAERMALHPRTQVHRVPEAVPDDVATLFIPLSNGLAWTWEAGELRPGDTVVVFGAGQHGVATAVAALRQGARQALVVGTPGDKHRLELAASFGCDVVALDPTTPPAEAVVDLVDRPADVVVDMTPDAALPLAASVEVAASGGRVLWGGLKRGDGHAQVPVDEVIRKELRVRGLWARPSWAIRTAFDWLAEDSDLRRLCERSYRLADLDAAFGAAIDPDPEARPLHIAVINEETTP